MSCFWKFSKLKFQFYWKFLPGVWDLQKEFPKSWFSQAVPKSLYLTVYQNSNICNILLLKKYIYILYIFVFGFVPESANTRGFNMSGRYCVHVLSTSYCGSAGFPRASFLILPRECLISLLDIYLGYCLLSVYQRHSATIWITCSPWRATEDVFKKGPDCR